jgi:general secretion pathway protein N
LFFADRSLPEIIDEEEAARLAAAEQQAEEQQPVATDELDARLAGIIITPDKRIAMIADNKSKKTLVLREGMALEGEQAGWQLAQISERTVSFAAGEESTELELRVNTKGLPAPAANTRTKRRQQASDTASDNQQQNAQEIRNQASNAASQREQTAAEIRRRIAERRAQLRAERARQAQDGNN